MDYTGERLIPGRKGLELLELEHRARYELVFPAARGRTVLDLGSGTGYGSSRLAEVAERVVGIDVSAESVEYSRGAFARSNLVFEQGDLTDDSLVQTVRSLQHDPFDLIVCFEVLEHVEKPVEVLARIKELLRPSGLLVLSTPNLARPQASVERHNPYHVVEYDESELTEVLRQHFSTVRLLRQTVHMASRITDDDTTAIRTASWRDAASVEAKYFVAVCSDRPAEEIDVEQLQLSTSDAHLMLLQDRLAELRQDQQRRAEKVEHLRSRVAELEQALDLRSLLERQEEAISELVEDRESSSRQLLRGVLRLLRDEDGGAVGETVPSFDRISEAAARLRRERDEARAEADRARSARQEIEELTREAEADRRRLGELRRQLEERSEAGAEIAEELASVRELLHLRTDELSSLRRRLSEAEALQKDLEHEVLSSREQSDAAPSFVRYFADLAARTDEEVGHLARRNAELEAGIARLALEARSAPADPRGRPARDVQPFSGTDVLHRELGTWRSLARDLASELNHVLNSRRWRFAMRLVRLRNFLLRIKEGDPIAAHLNAHLRRAGKEPTSFDLKTADARSIRRRFFWNRRPRSESEMQLLTDEERDAAARLLLTEDQETKVSVIMPTWNRGDRISAAIQSVRHQTYGNWELLVVDDGGTDDTADVVAKLHEAEPRIRYLRIPHQGVSAARDAGVKAAEGELIAYLDSDNRWYTDYLLFMVHAIRNSGRQCAYAALRIVDDDREGAVSYRKQRFDYGRLLKNNYIDINVFVHRAELFEELGGFDHELRRWVDWDLILRYTRERPPEEVPIVLCDYTRAKSYCQITLEEPQSFKFKVLNKHLIDWRAQERDLPCRVPGMVSIVIPTFNLPEMTAQSVEAVLAASGPEVEVVVVDNGSDRRKRRQLRDLLAGRPGVEILEAYENYGFALGCNLGAAASRGEFVVWLNNDTEVEPGWLEGLIEPLRKDPTVGIVGPKLLWPDGTLQHGGLVFNPRSKIPYHVYQGLPGDHPAVNQRRQFQVLSGACLALRASDFVALRGFDPIYLNGCEDLDFCLRMGTELGKKVVYNPASVVVHYEGKTPGRSKNIAFNRRTFVEAWGDRIRPDDQKYFESDGFAVREYFKKGAEPDGPAALYHPRLEKRSAAGEEVRRTPGREGTLRIGFVSIWYERGVAYVARQLALALEADSGFETHVLARWESSRFRNAGSIFHPRVTDGGDDPTPEETVAWARERRLDAVVFVEIHPNDWKRVEALRAAGVRVLCYEHLDILRMDMIDRYQQVDGFLANSFYTWRFWRREQPSKPALVVPWGIPPDLVRTNLDRVPDRETRFIHIAGWGGMNHRKNTGLCIEAFHEAAPSGARLVVYSQSPLESYGESCVRIVERDPAIEVHVGTVDDIWKIYRNADVLLWPSKREGLGLPILEALASGLPVVISDGWTMKEWPVLGEHAVVCAVREGEAEEEPVARTLPQVVVDRDDLVRRILELAESPARLAQMTEAVRRDRASWLWTWQTVMLPRQIRSFVETGTFPAEPSSYVPAHIVELEKRRARSRGEEPSPAVARAPRDAPATTPADDGDVRFLFIAGCQRSGTTALLHLLNDDERIVLGRERFKFCRSEITPEVFREKHFFSPRRSETNFLVEEFYDRLRKRWRSGTVRFIGDKVPFYYKDLFHLAEAFPRCKILFLLRDLEAVAASYNARAANPDDKVWKTTMDYQRAVEDWNESLTRLQKFVDAGHGEQVFVVHYESFFSGDPRHLDALYDFLEMPVTAEVRSAFQSMTGDWESRSSRPSSLTPEMVEYLAERRDRRLECRFAPLGPKTPDNAVTEAP